MTTLYFPAGTRGENIELPEIVLPEATFGAIELHPHSTMLIPFCFPGEIVVIHVSLLS